MTTRVAPFAGVMVACAIAALALLADALGLNGAAHDLSDSTET